jgi:hypothetical protein
MSQWDYKKLQKGVQIFLFEGMHQFVRMAMVGRSWVGCVSVNLYVCHMCVSEKGKAKGEKYFSLLCFHQKILFYKNLSLSDGNTWLSLEQSSPIGEKQLLPSFVK